MSCISYKLSLREQLVENIDWCSFQRAIKYHYRGIQLYVPIQFDLDPLNCKLYSKWYDKYKNTHDPSIGYRSMRNFDFMNVVETFYNHIIRNNYSKSDFIYDSNGSISESNSDTLMT
eukprot:297914_1